MLDKVLRLGALLDFYGALLTDKQRQCLEMHYLSDFSYSEIAEELQVSRQAIYDILRRSEQLLEEYEEKLRLVLRYQEEKKILKEVYQLLNKIPESSRNILEIHEALQKLACLLEDSREV